MAPKTSPVRATFKPSVNPTSLNTFPDLGNARKFPTAKTLNRNNILNPDPDPSHLVTEAFTFTEEFIRDDHIPPYAILSHTWGLDNEEVTFEDIYNKLARPSLAMRRSDSVENRLDRMVW